MLINDSKWPPPAAAELLNSLNTDSSSSLPWLATFSVNLARQHDASSVVARLFLTGFVSSLGYTLGRAADFLLFEAE